MPTLRTAERVAQVRSTIDSFCHHTQVLFVSAFRMLRPSAVIQVLVTPLFRLVRGESQSADLTLKFLVIRTVRDANHVTQSAPPNWVTGEGFSPCDCDRACTVSYPL